MVALIGKILILALMFSFVACSGAVIIHKDDCHPLRDGDRSFCEKAKRL